MNFDEIIKNRMIQLRKPSLEILSYPEQTLTISLDTHIGGKPYITKVDEWPVCTHCQKDMNFFFQLREVKENKEIKLMTFYKCDCQIKDFLPVLFIYEYDKFSPSLVDVSKFTGRKFYEYQQVEFNNYWSLPNWKLLPKVDSELYTLIKNNFDSVDDAEDYYNEQRASSIHSEYDGEVPFSFIKGYPEYLDKTHTIHCSCCNQETDFYFQLNSLPEIGLDFNELTLYCFKCPKTYNFILA